MLLVVARFSALSAATFKAAYPVVATALSVSKVVLAVPASVKVVAAVVAAVVLAAYTANKVTFSSSC